MKTFKIGNDRSLKLNKNDCISIEDKGTKKAAHFTPARWASFLQCLDQIDDQLRRLSEGVSSIVSGFRHVLNVSKRLQ